MTELSEQTAAPEVRKPRIIWLYIVGFLLIGNAAAMFAPAFLGQSFDPMGGLGSMIWTGLFFYLWWKRRARKGWHGALIGTALGLLVGILAGFIEAIMRNVTGA